MADDDQRLSQTINEISERATLIVREEIELARIEVTQKVTRLGKGAAVAAIAGVFGLLGLIFLLHTLAWALYAIFWNGAPVVWGFLIVTVLLFLLAGIAALIGLRLIKRGAPPTPDMAIEEAKRIRETVQR